MGKQSSSSANAQAQQAAAAQTGSNVQTAVAQSALNNTNQVTPYGNLTYNKNGTQTIYGSDGTVYTVPTYTATTTLSDAQKGLLDQENLIGSKLNNLAINQTDKISGLLGTNADLDTNFNTNFNTDFSRENLEKYINTHYLDDFNTQQDKDLSGLQSNLANQGISIGSTAYDRALSEYNTSKNNAYDNFLGSMYDNATNSMTGSNNAINAYNNALMNQNSTILSERNQPINEITALLGNTQVSSPSFVNTPSAAMAGTDVAGLMSQAQANRTSQNNAVLGGLAGIGGSLASGWAMSDERMKENKKKIGKLNDGTDVYSFDYKPKMGGGFSIGVMAQDIEKSHPDAVKKGDDGFRRVNYKKLAETVAKKRA